MLLRVPKPTELCQCAARSLKAATHCAPTAAHLRALLAVVVLHKVGQERLYKVVECGAAGHRRADAQQAVLERVAEPHLRHRQRRHHADGQAQQEAEQRGARPFYYLCAGSASARHATGRRKTHVCTEVTQGKPWPATSVAHCYCAADSRGQARQSGEEQRILLIFAEADGQH